MDRYFWDAALGRRSHRSLTMPLEMELGDPRLVLAICTFLSKPEQNLRKRSEEGATILSLVRLLRAVASRMGYAASRDVFVALDYVWHAVPALRGEVAAAMCYLDAPKKWDRLVELLEAGPSARDAEWLATSLNFAGEPPSQILSRFSRALITCVQKSKRPEQWVNALGNCADTGALDFLLAMSKTKISTSTRESLDVAIARVRKRELER